MEVLETCHCCIFCYRIFNQEGRIHLEMAAQERFLLLLKRHLQEKEQVYGSVKWVNLLPDAMRASESVRNTVISPCTDCSALINSFCEYYKEMKVLEMKLKWKLKTLADVVEGSENMHYRQGLFQEKLRGLGSGGNEMDVCEIMKQLKSFRTELVEICTMSSRDCYPKVELKRCDSSFEITRKASNRSHVGSDQVLFTEILNKPDLKVEPIPVDIEQLEGECKTPEELQLLSDSEAKSTSALPENSNSNNNNALNDDSYTESDICEFGDFKSERIDLEDSSNNQEESVQDNIDVYSDSDHGEGLESKRGSKRVGNIKVKKTTAVRRQVRGREKYACCFCNKSYLIRNKLIHHQNQVHLKISLEPPTASTKGLNSLPDHMSKDEIFECPVSSCPEEFMNKENLEAHAKLHGEFKCEFCDETKSYAPDLALHEATSHKRERKSRADKRNKGAIKTYSCARCDIREYKENIYLQHFLRAHLNLTMVVRAMCCICKSTFSSDNKHSITWHYDSHHNFDKDKPASIHRCELSTDCGAYFMNEDQLIFHKFIFHNERRKYPCPVCDKVFSQKYNIHKHVIDKHKDYYHIACPNERCQYRFSDESRMKKHVSMHHYSEQASKTICPQCEKPFKTSANLAVHIRTVHIAKPPKEKKRFACEHCELSYTTRGILSHHLKNKHGIHMQDGRRIKQHRIYMEAAGIGRKKVLRSESQSQCAKKMKVCRKCGKEFNRKQSLDMHVLAVHVGPEGWKFSCDVCKKKFLTQNRLDEHKKTHTKEMPFTCEHCGLCLRYRTNFKRHLKNKHGVSLGRPIWIGNKE